MGMTGIPTKHVWSEEKMFKEFRSSFKDHENPGIIIEDIPVSKDGDEIWGYRRKTIKGKSSFEFIIVWVIKQNNRREFIYKSMCEMEHPYYYKCPKKLLQLVPCPNNKGAKEWRKKVEGIKNGKNYEPNYFYRNEVNKGRTS